MHNAHHPLCLAFQQGIYQEEEGHKQDDRGPIGKKGFVQLAAISHLDSQ